MIVILKDAIIYEVQRVVANDSRLQLINTNVSQFEQGILIQMELYYIPLNVYKTFTITFNQTQIN